MHNEGLVRDLYDVQCFDLAAVASIGKNARHRAISAAQYASILENNVADRLDIVILGATEVDTDFNVNVTTASDGLIIGGSGGHADTANGARITVIVTPLLKTRLPVVKDRVVTVTTPGRDVDIVVTERGIAVNPARADLLEKLAGKGLPLVTIEELRDKAIKIAGRPERVPLGKRVVGVVRHRDLSVVDAIYETGGRR
jgi:citrate lyase subunit alpha/citrate CoA-transferase